MAIFFHCYAAIIPHGMNPGDTFIVEIPRNNNNNSFNMNQNLNNNNNNYNNQPPIIPSAPPKEEDISVAPPAVQAAPVSPVPVPLEATVVPDSRQDSTTSTSTRINNSNQKLMLVQVPPGVAPGSTINVQVPGENRMISAQVPHGVTEFHVAYTPMQQNQHQQQPVTIMGQPMKNNSGNYNNYSSGPYGNNYNNNNGNYGYNGYNNNNGNYGCNNNDGNYGYNNNNYNRNNNRFGNGFGNNSGYRPNNNGYNNYNNGYGNNNNSGGGGLGLVAPVLAGAALMGGAGYLIHQHHNHQQEDGGDYNNGGEDYDNGGGGYDDGGGDVGDYDAGGGDDMDFGGGDY